MVKKVKQPDLTLEAFNSHKRVNHSFPRRDIYTPTLEEIARVAAEIRAGWNDDERYRRLRGAASGEKRLFNRKTDRDGIINEHTIHLPVEHMPSFEGIV